jgi:hypothetical protein
MHIMVTCRAQQISEISWNSSETGGPSAIECVIYVVGEGKGKGEVHPITGHEGPEVE